MTLHARQLGFVEVPHLTGWVLDADDAILDAYKLSPRRLPAHRALWEARSGRRAAWWTIWDGDRFTGEILTHREAAEGCIPATAHATLDLPCRHAPNRGE